MGNVKYFLDYYTGCFSCLLFIIVTFYLCLLVHKQYRWSLSEVDFLKCMGGLLERMAAIIETTWP